MAQSHVDSLKSVLVTAKEDTNKLGVLISLGNYFLERDPRAALGYGQQAMLLASKLNNGEKIGDIEFVIGGSYAVLRNYTSALDHLKLSTDGYSSKGDSEHVAFNNWCLSNVLLNLGDTALAMEKSLENLGYQERHSRKEDVAQAIRGVGNAFERAGRNEQAMAHYQRALNMAKVIRDSSEIIFGQLFVGGLHDAMDDSAEAESELLEGLRLAESLGWTNHQKQAHGSLTGYYVNHKRWDHAAAHVRESIALSKGSGDDDELAFLLSDLGHILLETDSAGAALGNFRSALRASTKLGNLRSQANALEGISSAFRKLHVADSALVYVDRFLIIKDSSEQSQEREEAARLLERTKYLGMLATDSLAHVHALELKSQEVRKQKLVRNGSLAGLSLVAVFAAIFLFQRNRIGKEKKRSDELLLNILPEEVAEELKATGAARAREFDGATILFTDFKGFTTISEKLSPTELVDELNACFKAFDHIVTGKGIEKIKTIGDAYMAVGGLPDPKTSTPADVVFAALEMQSFMIARKTERDALSKPAFEMRVGIHTGPVVAGIVGVKKFAYDIWGDTVNIASRMESSGEIGQVNISEATYGLVREQAGRLFHFTSRGMVQVKGKGELEMYFVHRSSTGE